MSDILVVMPTLNEVDNLARTVGRVRQQIPHADVLIIDDASSDGTSQLADKLAADDASVSVVHRQERGFASAILHAFRHAIDAKTYKHVVTVDADGSYDLGTLNDLLQAAQSESLDLVIGSRWVPGADVRNMAGRRRASSWVGNLYSRSLLGTSVRDLTSATRVYSVSILRSLPLDRIRSEAYAFQIEMVTRVAQAGGRIAELPIDYVERSIGKSKMRMGDVLSAGAKVTRWGVRGVRAKPRERGQSDR
ncbi:glycosyltransferase [Agrococcus casei]|uniref:Dolichol-phosphate mannosyltransferase in lipid-linked oligosaccharide synthesis cluster n=2 Tax=Agrococcus TaxID=46352 RepID=A0A1R4FSR1_9MICO|nr:glycosyltransferase [Agrococcus casei]SJM58945.1 Dolichol-phosphate mannosyltransferase in lipid-linked oligosaccharide synthesis cluster [Agrococcus casei LMG 22410]